MSVKKKNNSEQVEAAISLILASGAAIGDITRVSGLDERQIMALAKGDIEVTLDDVVLTRLEDYAENMYAKLQRGGKEDDDCVLRTFQSVFGAKQNMKFA